MVDAAPSTGESSPPAPPRYQSSENAATRKSTTGYAASPFQYAAALSWQPEQDYYWLFMGRAVLGLTQGLPEGAASLPPPSAQDILTRDWRRGLAGGHRDDSFNFALASLQEALRLSPLNSDHPANLARTYKLWGGNVSDPARKATLFQQSIDH